MSSLQRSRSLRKPSAINTDVPCQDPKSNGSSASPSRLPTKPLQRTASTTVNSNSNPTALRTGRVLSGSVQRSTSTRQAKAVQEPTKRETARYPPSTTQTRTTAPPRPTSSSGVASQPKRTISHVRAKSTTTAVNAAAISRPPSQGKTGPAVAAPRTLHRRNQSVDQAAQHTQQAPPRPTASAQPRLRPAFSTLQQHYSPAKTLAPKPLTSTFLAPPSPSKLPANVATSAETSKLQVELLQLHLLDRESAGVEALWHASAKEKLGRRFTKLISATNQLSDNERALDEVENILALRQWERQGGLDERIQTLDTVMQGVWALSEPNGRYARIIRRFERWLDRVREIEEARKRRDAFSQNIDDLFFGELDSSWKEDCSGIGRRLSGWHKDLEDMHLAGSQEKDGNSSITRMVEGSQALIEGMLAELQMMDDIERQAALQESEWIEETIRDEADSRAGAGAIWRVT
ncbi:AGA1 A-agglutinin anchor subunit [Paramyrothecium foliicola]|nr:AGA1 A-agglutinin anchor subunit [Paramyrothecium foliicola]